MVITVKRIWRAIVDTIHLVENLRRGERVQSSQEQLYERLRSELLKPIERRIRHQMKSRLDAEDVLHEAFLRAISSVDVFQPSNESTLYAWVFSIAKHLIVDHSRRRSFVNVHLARGDDGSGPHASRLAAPRGGLHTAVERREWVEYVLSRLKPREAEVIRLHKLEGRSLEEIAGLWAKKPGAVQRFYSRALDRFRDVVSRGEG